LVEPLDASRIGENRLPFGAGEIDSLQAELLLGLKLGDDDGPLRLPLSGKIDLLLEKLDLVLLPLDRLQGRGTGLLPMKP